MYNLGIDIGGTQIKIGVVDNNMNIITKNSVDTKTPCSMDDFCDNLKNSINELLKSANISLSEIKQIGVGVPGSIDPQAGVISFSANLGFKDFPIKSMLEKRFLNIPLKVANDANAAAFGEYKAGSLKGHNNAIAITLGTGVGGGIIIDGKIYTSFNYSAGELGHMVIVADGRQCNCGRKGCFETYSSATGLITTTKEYMNNDKNSVMWEIVGGNIDKVNGLTAYDAMRKNDESGVKAVNEYVKYLGTGLSNIINAFQPEIICIGGGVSNEGETLIAPLRKFCEKETYITSKRTKIVKATLGNDAGLIGAALLD